MTQTGKHCDVIVNLATQWSTLGCSSVSGYIEKGRERRVVTQVGAKWLTWPSWSVASQPSSVPEAYMCDEVKSLGESSVGPFFTEYLSHAGLGLPRTDADCEALRVVPQLYKGK